MLITDFHQKANLFNSFFAKQCTIVQNNSLLPPFSLLTGLSIESLEINSTEIKNILCKLQPSKSHGWDGISIRMIKLCGDSIVEPLKLIFENCIRSSVFPILWKRGNIVPVHKKNSKQEIKNYRPISLLPIFSKVFEKIIFNEIYKYFNANHLFCINQSGFRPGDSCTNQLIAITHNIFKAFDCNPSLDVRGVFLDISKAFEKCPEKDKKGKVRV